MIHHLLNHFIFQENAVESSSLAADNIFCTLTCVAFTEKIIKLHIFLLTSLPLIAAAVNMNRAPHKPFKNPWQIIPYKSVIGSILRNSKNQFWSPTQSPYHKLLFNWRVIVSQKTGAENK